MQNPRGNACDGVQFKRQGLLDHIQDARPFETQRTGDRMMTVGELRRKARRIYNNDLVPAHINQHNQRKWVRSVLRLGDRWLIAHPIERIHATQSNS